MNPACDQVFSAGAEAMLSASLPPPRVALYYRQSGGCACSRWLRSPDL